MGNISQWKVDRNPLCDVGVGETRVPTDHPPGAIRALVDGLLRDMSPDFDRMTSNPGVCTIFISPNGVVAYMGPKGRHCASIPCLPKSGLRCSKSCLAHGCTASVREGRLRADGGIGPSTSHKGSSVNRPL